jgi:hypothetical protein
MNLDNIRMCREDSIVIPEMLCDVHSHNRDYPTDIFPKLTYSVAIAIYMGIMYLIATNL